MKTILLLEDELCLMKLLSRVLERHGYIVWGPGAGEDAIARFADANCKIDLLVADVNLPASSGVQIALLLRAARPSLNVILTSGYPTNAWKAEDVADLERLGSDSVIVLEKLFMSQSLLNCIRKLTEVRVVAVGATQTA
jgi:CheY-like chemotaxis protein